MNAEESFFNSISDEQRGYFHAHEYSENLEELLQDLLTFKQFTLFKEYKACKDNVDSPGNFDNSLLMNNLLDKMEVMFTKLETRIDLLERKIDSVAESVAIAKNEIAEEVQERLSKTIEYAQSNTTAYVEYLKATIDGHNKQVFTDDQAWLDDFAHIIEVCLNEGGKENFGTKDNIQTTVRVMKRHCSNKKIEKTGFAILNKLAKLSESARENIIKEGVLDYLAAIYMKKRSCRDKEEDQLIDIIWVFLRMGHHKDSIGSLVKDKYLDMFLTSFAIKEFTKLGILSVYMLVLLLDNTEWNVELNKDELEDKIIECLRRFKLVSFDTIMTVPSFTWYLEKLKTGTRAQKYYSAWLLANQSTSEKAKLLMDAKGGVPTLELVLKLSDVDEEVKTLLEIAIDNFKK